MWPRLCRAAACLASRRTVLALLVFALLLGLAYQPLRRLWGRRQFHDAERAYQSLDWQNVRTHLNEYLAISSNDLDARLMLARVSLRAGFYDEASVQLDLCETLAHPRAVVQLERQLLGLYEGDLTHEAELWLLVGGDHEQTPMILEALARGYQKNYLVNRMQRALDQLVAAEPRHIQAYLDRGWIYERRFNHLAALEDYERALAVDSQHFGAKLHKAQTLIALARSAEALPIFEELWAERSDDARIGLGLFRALVKLGRGDDARKLDEVLSERFPKDVILLVERARFYLQSGQPEDAEQVLRVAIAESPFDYHAHFTLHQALQHQARGAEAAKVKARIDQLAFDLDQMSDLTEKLQKAPYDAELRCKIAQIFLRSGEVKEGVSWLKTVLRINPRHVEAHRLLAEYYQGSRQPALAEQHRKLAGLPAS